MEGHGLSHDEQRVLYAIEEALRAGSTGLDRRLRTMRPRLRDRIALLAREPLAYVVAILGGLALALVVIGVRTSSTAAVWAFSGTWTLALLAAVVLARTIRRDGPRDT